VNKSIRKILRASGLYDRVVDFKKWLAEPRKEYREFYSQFVNEGDLCFDVGANVGRRSKIFLELGAKVITVEPQPDCMTQLKKKYDGNSHVVLVQKAVGETRGSAEMMLCDSHSLSSLSKSWIETVKSSGRYSSCTWNKAVTVAVVTLDDLISQYGKPAFIKIDIEGYEYEAVKGLSQPVGMISLEFTPEFMDSTLKCVEHLSKISASEFNYCLDDKPTAFVLSQWCSQGQIRERLESMRGKARVGDIYIRSDA